MPTPSVPLAHPVHRFAHHEIDFRRRIVTMAVVNRTPDSFFDDGAGFAFDAALAQVHTAADAGAEWVDVGGVPFAPGRELDPAEEAARVAPFVAAVRAGRGEGASEAARRLILSADTFQPAVAEAAIDAGADVVNDTTGLYYPDLGRVVAASNAHLVVTHSLAHVSGPRTVVPRPRYDDVVAEVREHLLRTVDRAVALGVPEERIIVDPGHDLNKTTVHTLEVTRRLDEIADLGFPVLAAVSNKDFIGESLDRHRHDRLAGTLASAAFCALAGARILRMHDADASVSTAHMLECILGWREPLLAVHNTGDVNPAADRTTPADRVPADRPPAAVPAPTHDPEEARP
ncbi:dihydropteroate synthase [Micrococcus porci]|uniref:dihydropteroate synthase n=1 Tax=Micrococcus porci TaxID=2856555 RepID=UPI001CD01032|nr:dihydropteroate synthase [Micrococcus porci]UBH23591.1 dihydropteroate synthase [Micrococcus porci]